MTLTLDAATIQLLAQAAQSGGGRHAFRVKDDAVRDAAKALADSARKERRSAARKQRSLDRAADVAALRAFNSYDATKVCASQSHTDECCDFGRLVSIWKSMPSFKAIKRMARELFNRGSDTINRDSLPVTWRDSVRAYRDGKALAAELGSFSISRDDMRADSRSRFWKRAQYLLSVSDNVNVVVSADDVVQDGFLASIESGDGVAFGSMFRHVKSAAVSAPWRYRRMGNRHSDNVRDWTWADWETWAAQNDGSDRFAHSTNEEWQAFDAARTAHNAAQAHREFVAKRRLDESTALDECRRAFVMLISQGAKVSEVCKMIGRDPETILAELYSEDRSPRLV